MTVTMHVLPVGLSLLTRAKTEQFLRGLRTVLRPAMFDGDANRSRKVQAELARLAHPATGELDLNAVLPSAEHWRAVRSDNPRLCAEWTSVAVEQSRTSGPGAFVLIASDTDDGLRSAVFVAGQYAPDRRIHYVDDPVGAALTMALEPGGVYVFRIPGLDLENHAMTDATWFALGSVGHAIQRTARRAIAGRWDVVLHLTGGYKAMLPYLLVMAEGIETVFKAAGSTLGERTPTLRAVSVHEHDPDAPLSKLVQVPVPIRWVESYPLQALRDLKDGTLTDARVTGDEWREWQGQWIEAGGGKLSPAGMILTRVL